LRNSLPGTAIAARLLRVVAVSTKACLRGQSPAALVVGALLASFLLGSLDDPGRAGEPPPASTTSEDPGREEVRARWLAQMRQAATQYTLHRSEDRSHPLKLVEEPVLRFTNDVNPVKVTKDGSVFIWTDRGRPEAIVQFFTYDEQSFNHEWQSLSLSSLSAQWDGAEVWTPTAAGISLSAVAQADPPARSAAVRLRQMKRLAERWDATFLPVVAGRLDQPTVLRLLPQPLYRYESSQPDLLDGALFAFVLGTDPQALLILEARRESAAGTFQWQSAWARMASGTLAAGENGREVWSVPKYDFKRDPRQPFLLLPQGPAPHD
jgi:hypothetical protein